MNTPVLYLIFNRPKETELSFERIRQAKPAFLYIAADGPRKDKIGEAEKCEKARAITEKIDWPCEVKRLYRKENLGCGKAVSEAITWFFEQEEMGIILEDDCLADDSFFDFCSQLLIKYRNNEEIMEISGTNLISKNISKAYSYYFSQYGGIWGWATWRRAWSKYNLQIPDYLTYKKKLDLKSWGEKRFFYQKFDQCYAKRIDTWDFQWIYTKLKNNGLSVVPSENLISNIGFGNDSTFTKNKTNFHLNPTTTIVDFIHPEKIKLERKNDVKYISLFNVQTNNLIFIISLIKNKLARLIQ